MAVDLSTLGGAGAQFFDNNGVPLAGGKLYSYAASTTTPKATFTSSSGNVPHTNPIILDSSGRVPSGGEIWLTSGEPYKFVLETSTGILLGTWDNIYGYTTGSADASSEVQTATAGQTLFVLNSMAYAPGTNTLAVYIDGVNQVVNNSYIETNATSVTFVSGLHEGAVVKFSKINIGATDANVVSYEPGFLGSVATTVADKLQQYVSVKDFGAVGDGVADDTAAFVAALATEKIVTVPQGTYVLSGSDVLDIDVSKTGLVGDGAIIDATAVTGYVARLFSSVTTLQNRALNNFNKNAITGVSFLGTNSPGNFGLIIGRPGAGYSQSNDIVVERCGFYGFEKQLVFDDNGWRTKFVNCGFEGGAYPIYYNQPSNAGEVMEFDHCWIVDWTVGPVMVSGNFLFNGCSFIGGATTPITFNQNARADFVGCNFEDQADGNFWLAINGVADVSIFGGQLLVNSTRTKPLIYMASGARLSLSGTALSLYGANLQYETNADTGKKIRSIVEGEKGYHVNAVGCNTLSGTLPNYTIQAVLGGSNAIYNSDAEIGNTNGWTLAEYGGTGSTFAASATYPKNGTYGFLLTAPANVGAYAYQTVDVSAQAGRSYCFGFWARAVSGTGAIGYPKIRFLAANGTTIVEDAALDAINSTATTYTWYARNGYIPDGARTAEIRLEAEQLAGGCSLAYDDVVFQII